MSNANSLELEMLALINAEREAAGLEPLRLITLLNDAAEVHSQWMLQENQFSHEGESGSSPSERMEDAGYPFEGNYLSLENIAWQSARGEEGFSDDVRQLHEGLMESPGHRANILNPDAEDIGIGIEIGTFSTGNGDFEAIMATQVFGTTDADLSAWVDPGTGESVEEPEPVDPTPADPTPVDPDPVDPEPTDPSEEPDEPETPDVCEAPDDEMAEEDTDDDNETPVMPPEGEEDVAEDDTPADMPEKTEDDADPDIPEPTPTNFPEIPLPCELSEFTVDLSGAFEFRQEGDQLIWETSEDKLVETFMAAFEEWANGQDDIEPDATDLLMEETMEDELAAVDEFDEMDEWLCGA